MAKRGQSDCQGEYEPAEATVLDVQFDREGWHGVSQSSHGTFGNDLLCSPSHTS